jgi:hypothetical protein
MNMTVHWPEAVFILVCLIIGITLIVGTYNRWNWLVNPATNRWWYYPPALLNRLFGSAFLVVTAYVLGFLFFAASLFSFNGGLRYVYYQTHYDPPATNMASWNVYTGVIVESLEACTENSKSKILELQRNGDDLRVRIRNNFPCDRQLKAPYLTVGVDNRYTLVMSSIYPLLFDSACDCTKEMTIKITKRLPKGATLYILNDSEVLGHFLVP